ncbi:MAG: hypothetical protein ACREB9_03490 [Thermoplasmata archaeon]
MTPREPAMESTPAEFTETGWELGTIRYQPGDRKRPALRPGRCVGCGIRGIFEITSPKRPARCRRCSGVPQRNVGG